jgi:polyphosphate kinase
MIDSDAGLYMNAGLYMDKSLDNIYMQNRELSWMKFNERVLEEAIDETVPLFERLKFISIFTSNFDEFFMVRVGSLSDLAIRNNNKIDNKTGMNPKQQLDKIFQNAVPLYELREKIFIEVETKLRKFGIYNLEIHELVKNEKMYIKKYFENYILPYLSPQIIEFGYPFPYLINKALYIICDFQDEDNKFGLIPIPWSLQEFVLLPGDQTRYVLTEKIILEYIADIFHMYVVNSSSVISVTRDADISTSHETFEVDNDYKEKMKKIIKRRARLSLVRLEVQGQITESISDFLLDKLNLDKRQVFTCSNPLVLKYVYALGNKLPVMLMKQLSYPAFEAGYPATLNKVDSITNQCKKNDILLYYPYHQMEPFLHLLKESAKDPCVISIQITIYRLSRNSRIIDYLCMAAENNKEVTVLIELKARFDEKNNIEWAERLEASGCNVIYGFEGFKVHAKICLITRRDRNKIVFITQTGTGNYNEKTANIYSDLSLITTNQEIGQDANEFFKNMSISNLKGIYKHLMVAPFSFKTSILELIEKEIEKASRGEKSRILFKLNSLTDIDIINKLSAASQAGVQVVLIIRGICCLLPGIQGKTENIKVISIVGRFLEHARIYCFGIDNTIRLYIASADMMTRNTSRRVEIACPVLDSKVKNEILHILNIMISDNTKARLLQSDGNYIKVGDGTRILIDSQNYFIKEIT